MSGPGGLAHRGKGSPQSVRPIRVPNGAAEAMQQMQAQAEAEVDFAARREHFSALVKLQRHGVHDTNGCPKCGQKQLGKVHCAGRSPNDTPRECPCFILGSHLHAQCGTCRYVWVEHSLDDTLDLDWRGALRHDEALVDGQVVPIEGIMEPEMLWRFKDTDAEA